MRIESSALQMQAQHAATRVHTQTSRLEMWVGERPNNVPPRPAPPTPAVQISSAARLAQAAAQSIESPPERNRDEGLTPQLAMIRDLIERLTGVLVRVYTGTETTAPPPTDLPRQPEAAGTSNAAPPRAGFGLIDGHNSADIARGMVLHTTRRSRS